MGMNYSCCCCFCYYYYIIIIVIIIISVIIIIIIIVVVVVLLLSLHFISSIYLLFIYYIYVCINIIPTSKNAFLYKKRFCVSYLHELQTAVIIVKSDLREAATCI